MQRLRTSDGADARDEIHVAAGLPIVATDLGRLRDTIRNGVTGFLVPSENAQAIAERVLGLLSNETRGKMLAEEAHTYVVEHYAMGARHIGGFLS